MAGLVFCILAMGASAGMTIQSSSGWYRGVRDNQK